MQLRSLARIAATLSTVASRRIDRVRNEGLGPTATNNTCLSLWNTANATGYETFQLPQISQLEEQTSGGGGVQPLAWAVTVNAPPVSLSNDSIDNIVWLGTPPDVHLNNPNNSFSGCAMLFTELPINTISRGQDDEGGCEQTFSTSCVQALEAKAAAVAQELTAGCTPGANSNCTIQSVCPDIFAGLGTQNSIPPECAPFFDIGTNDQVWPSANISAITSDGTNSPPPAQQCSIKPNATGYERSHKFVPIFDLSNELKTLNGNQAHDNNVYDNITNTIWPILTVFMPPASGIRNEAFLPASAAMTCLRRQFESSGSRQPNELAAPTPVSAPTSAPTSSSAAASSTGLSAGEIGGIVAGSVVLVALAAGIGAFFGRRRASARRANAAAGRPAFGQPSPRFYSNPGVVSMADVTSNPFLSHNTSRAGSYHSNESVRSFHNPPQYYQPPPPGNILGVYPNQQHNEPVELPPHSSISHNPYSGAGPYFPAEVAAQEARVVRQSYASTATTPFTAASAPLRYPSSHWARKTSVRAAPPPPLPLSARSAPLVLASRSARAASTNAASAWRMSEVSPRGTKPAHARLGSMAGLSWSEGEVEHAAANRFTEENTMSSSVSTMHSHSAQPTSFF